MHIFYKDKPSLFEFKINVEGAELDNTFSRVILENNNRKYLFEGTIKDGVCSIEIPALKEFKETKTSKLLVEVVADSTYFAPYTSEYEVKESKKVVVEMIERKPKQSKPTVIVEAIIKEELKPLAKKIEVKKNFEKEFISLFEKHKSSIKITKTTPLSSKMAIDISKFLTEKKVINPNDETKLSHFIDTKISHDKLTSIQKALGFVKNKA
ncbi:MAG: hypothetical protein ABIP51_01595 [Bacteroidia bacterium]